jgi:hypothetical protein
MDVDKVERKLLALYKKMVGPGVWPVTHVIEWDAFLLSIKTCVFEFWYPTGEGDWATRWDWKKKTWVTDKQTGMYEREMRLEDEEALIRGKVREELEKAAGMTAFKVKYSPSAQTQFDELLQYVKWWCAAEQVMGHESLARAHIIRKYANDDHQLWRDSQLLKRLNSEEFEMELQLKKQWETDRKLEPGVGTLLSALVKYAE